MRKLFMIFAFLLVATPAYAGWMVTWNVVEMRLVPCQQAEPVPDEFGRMPNNMVTLAVACYETVIHPQSRVYKTIQEADAFVERGKSETSRWGLSSLQNFEITVIEAGSFATTTEDNMLGE